MNNRNISPLYIYTESRLIDESINVRILTKAYNAVNGIVINCCPVYASTQNNFLRGFYALLKTMPIQYSLNKLKAVKDLLGAKIACCAK